MTRIDQDFLTISHGLEQFLITLFLLNDLLFRVEVLSLFPYFLFNNIFSAQPTQFLFQHQLMVLIAHEFFDLLLTALEFDHNLTVSLLDCLTVITLPTTAVFERLFSILLCLVVLCKFLLIEEFHLSIALILFFVGTFKRPFHIQLFFVSVRLKFLTKGLVAAS